LIRRAYAQHRVIITHDRDFGSLAIANLEPVVGIVYLRPGHIDSTFIVETLQVLLDNNIEISSPFIVVADRKVNSVNIRIRPL
jgi:predicted nuclease of predicted toxin-antitoxin system